MKLYLRILTLILIFAGFTSCQLEEKEDPKPEPTIENPQIKFTGTTAPNPDAQNMNSIVIERDFTTNLDSGNYVLTMNYKLTKGSNLNNTLWLSFFDSQWKSQMYGLKVNGNGLTNTITIDLNDFDHLDMYDDTINRADQKVLQLLFSVAEATPVDFELFIESIEIKDGENVALSSSTADGWRSATGTIDTVEKE